MGRAIPYFFKHILVMGIVRRRYLLEEFKISRTLLPYSLHAIIKGFYLCVQVIEKLERALYSEGSLGVVHGVKKRGGESSLFGFV